MPAILLIVVCIVAYFLGYSIYARYIQNRILRLDPSRKTPAHLKKDGVDYVPARKMILFGHHFASIAGLGPIIGPAIAAQWGWLPAFLWLIVGGIFLGAVHDFVAVGVSLRFGGRSIGDITRDIIGPRARVLFLLVVFFVIGLFMAAFAVIVAGYLVDYPTAVIPVCGLIVIATLMGTALYRFKIKLWIVTVLGIGVMAFLFYLGIKFPIEGISREAWLFALLGYSGVASVLPVWLLLQPRDYLNSFQLYGGLALLLVSIIVLGPVMGDVPTTHKPAGDGDKIPPVVPFIFIIVACGAISGFHSLVSSGTTVRQLNNERDARLVTFGSMLTESLFAVLALIACTAGLGYAAWQASYAAGAANPLGIFKEGSAKMATSLGISFDLAGLLLSVMAVGFAMTTLDTATRLLRFNVEEIGKSFKLNFLRSRYLATVLAVGWIAFFALLKFGGKPAWQVLWPMAGASNQILVVLGLLAMSVYLYRLRRPTFVTLVPLVIMICVTIWALVATLINDGIAKGEYGLAAVSGALLVLALWLAVEAVLKAVQMKRLGRPESEELIAEEAAKDE